MQEVIRQDYIRTARAKGVGYWRILFHHAFRNTLIPLVTLVGLELPALLSGSIILEQIFSWPGMGKLFFESIRMRDYPVLMGLILMFSDPDSARPTVGRYLLCISRSARYLRIKPPSKSSPLARQLAPAMSTVPHSNRPSVRRSPPTRLSARAPGLARLLGRNVATLSAAASWPWLLLSMSPSWRSSRSSRPPSLARSPSFASTKDTSTFRASDISCGAGRIRFSGPTIFAAFIRAI